MSRKVEISDDCLIEKIEAIAKLYPGALSFKGAVNLVLNLASDRVLTELQALKKQVEPQPLSDKSDSSNGSSLGGSSGVAKTANRLHRT